MNRKAKKQAGKQDQEGEAGVGTAHLLEVDFLQRHRDAAMSHKEGISLPWIHFLLYIFTHTHVRLQTYFHMFKIYLHANARQRINYTSLLNKWIEGKHNKLLFESQCRWERGGKMALWWKHAVMGDGWRVWASFIFISNAQATLLPPLTQLFGASPSVHKHISRRRPSLLSNSQTPVTQG